MAILSVEAHPLAAASVSSSHLSPSAADAMQLGVPGNDAELALSSAGGQLSHQGHA